MPGIDKSTREIEATYFNPLGGYTVHVTARRNHYVKHPNMVTYIVTLVAVNGHDTVDKNPCYFDDDRQAAFDCAARKSWGCIK